MPEADLSLIFLRPLNRLGIRYIVGGGVAAILYGEPRFTNDLDLVVFLRHTDIPRLNETFPAPKFYVPPSDMILAEIARPEKGQFNLVHAATGFKADVYTTGRDDFNAWAFRNACKTDYLGEVITLAPPEYVIVRKLEYYREGGSDKHLRDIRSILNVSFARINQTDLQEWIKQRGVEAEWRKIVA
ncbi:MAG TPA: hypothetical protein PKA41_09090 [Verrucomicrobiota bacterium]|nr:hypothetical protein [Verrucomicrobiota bacterium]